MKQYFHHQKDKEIFIFTMTTSLSALADLRTQFSVNKF